MFPHFLREGLGRGYMVFILRPIVRHFTQKMHHFPKSFIIRALKTKDLRIAPQLARFVSIRPLQTVERRINKQ